MAADDSPVETGERVAIPELEFEKLQKLAFEKEMLGLYVSDHPLMGAESVLRRHIECSIAEAADLDDGAMRNLAGVVTGLQRKYTKRGDLMATFVLEDLAAAIEVMVFPKTMQQYGELLEPDAIVVLKSRIDKREDTPKLIAMEITRPEINLDGALPLTLRVKATVLTDQRVGRLRELLRAHPGDCPVFVRVIGSEKETVLRLGDDFRCDARNGLYAELRVLFGADCIA
jgi:DNA polymerase-3 subunit alpha